LGEEIKGTLTSGAPVPPDSEAKPPQCPSAAREIGWTTAPYSHTNTKEIIANREHGHGWVQCSPESEESWSRRAA
jgi:hypothetical protein